MDDQHAATEAPRQYGELYYRADAVAALLRGVAVHLEGDIRNAMLRLSHDIPTTMPWPDDSPDPEYETREHSVYCPVQLRLLNTPLFGDFALRLVALLWHGASTEREPDWEYIAGLADEQSDVK